jgi:hypothetical protein
VFSLPFKDIVKCIVGYESVKYWEPLVSRVTQPAEQKKHTVVMIVPKEELARLFLDWMKEIRTRQDTMDGKERNRLHWWVSRWFMDKVTRKVTYSDAPA